MSEFETFLFHTLMKYFTLAECTRSAAAALRRIDNTPNAEQTAHIVEAVERLLDPLRAAWELRCLGGGLGEAAVRVSSGFRTPRLNAAIGGSPTSAHCCGYAFDLQPCNGRMAEFKRFCRAFLADRPFDQLISEAEDAAGVPAWIHLGYRSPRGEQRRQFLSMRDGRCLPMT